MPVATVNNAGFVKAIDYARSFIFQIGKTSNPDTRLFKICSIESENAVFIMRITSRSINTSCYDANLMVDNTGTHLKKTSLCYSGISGQTIPKVYEKKEGLKRTYYISIGKYLSCFVRFEGGFCDPEFYIEDVTSSVSTEDLQLLELE